MHGCYRSFSLQEGVERGRWQILHDKNARAEGQLQSQPGGHATAVVGELLAILGDLCGTNFSEHRDFSCLLAAEKTKSLSSDKTGPENRSCAVGIP